MQLMFRKPAIDQSAGNLTPEVIGNIELKNVHFTYPSRRNNPILNVRQISLKFLKIDFQDVSLEINKGETVALVGPSGGGKSSIVSLIERFYKPLMGNIYLDGTPINQFEHRYYHRKVNSTNHFSITTLNRTLDLPRKPRTPTLQWNNQRKYCVRTGRM